MVERSEAPPVLCDSDSYYYYSLRPRGRVLPPAQHVTVTVAYGIVENGVRSVRAVGWKRWYQHCTLTEICMQQLLLSPSDDESGS